MATTNDLWSTYELRVLENVVTVDRHTRECGRLGGEEDGRAFQALLVWSFPAKLDLSNELRSCHLVEKIWTSYEYMH